MNKVEITTQEIFAGDPYISDVYSQFLYTLDQQNVLSQLEIVSLDYTTKSNYQNDMPIGDELYILHNGHIALLRSNKSRESVHPDMPETIALQYINTPGVIVNPLILLGEHRNDRIRPLADTELLSIPLSITCELAKHDPNFAKMILYSSSRAVSSLEQQMLVRSANRNYLYTMLASYFLCHQVDDLIPITQIELAGLFGTDRPTMGRIVRELAEKNIIEIGLKGRTIKIQDSKTLGDLADQY